jgi:hypothetical protein
MRTASCGNTIWLQFGRPECRGNRASIGTTASCLFAACLLCGCIPYAERGHLVTSSRANVTEVAQRHIEIGKTTRVDVLLALGAPDGRATDDSWFTYGSERAWGAGLVAPFLPLIGIQGSDIYRLLIKFDANGIVSAADPQQSKCRGFMQASGCLGVRGNDVNSDDHIRESGPAHQVRDP